MIRTTKALFLVVAFIVGTMMGDANDHTISELCIITSCIMSKCTVPSIHSFDVLADGTVRVR